MNKIDVLNLGYVSLVSTMGNDLEVANAARVSYDKRSELNDDGSLKKGDQRLIDFLWEEEHTSPFRHCVLSFEIYAPLMVARQHWKYAVASTFVDDQNGWNESCLPEWQELWSYGNKKITVGDILKNINIPLRSVSAAGTVVPNRVKGIWETGKQEVYRITDEFGNRVSCTRTHRISTPDGWVKAGNLSVGDLIAHKGLGFGFIVSIEPMGKMKTYDIEMELESNFIAGGIVVHNSRRYITEEPEFYLPTADQWRSAPENSKQGSGEPINYGLGVELTMKLFNLIEAAENEYTHALDMGVCAEQARLFLPAYGMYVRYRWTTSLHGVMHFTQQRLAHDAQVEIQGYARAIADLSAKAFPYSMSLVE